MVIDVDCNGIIVKDFDGIVWCIELVCKVWLVGVLVSWLGRDFVE